MRQLIQAPISQVYANQNVIQSLNRALALLSRHRVLTSFRTTSGPSLKDAQLIEVGDETLDASITAINAQIAVQLAHIKFLERDRARLVQARHRKQALRVPILHIPTEIIELIIRAASRMIRRPLPARHVSRSSSPVVGSAPLRSE